MSNRTIQQAIRTLAGVSDDQVQLLTCEVLSVDEGARTCTVTTTSGRDTIEIENVRLMSTIDDGVLLVPTVGSTVLVSYSTYNQPFVSLFSSLDKVLFIVGDSSVEVTSGEIKMNDGSDGGLVKVIELTEKLNNLENKLNDLITLYNAHVHTSASAGSPTSTTPSIVAGTLTPTVRTEIENQLVNHGS